MRSGINSDQKGKTIRILHGRSVTIHTLNIKGKPGNVSVDIAGGDRSR